jgi:hypothetical protein
MQAKRVFSYLLILASGLFLPCPAVSQAQPEPFTFFRQYAKLSEAEIDQIRSGKAFAKIIETGTPDQVFVMGAVHVHADPTSYLALAADLSELKRLPGYLALGKFSRPPRISDLDGFSLTPEDIVDLRKCKPDDCDVQLPANVLAEVQRSVDWNGPNVERDVNQLARRLAMDAVVQYQKGGNLALGTYRDKKKPTVIADAFQSLISQSRALPEYMPELQRYLLNFPQFQSPRISSEFYWEKVDFGLKPTVRIIQQVLFNGSDSGQTVYAVALKQLYSSHYFETALDLTVCVKDRSGFYLITLKGSQQAGLTGFKGLVVRKVAVEKTRSSLERGLGALKERLEATRISAKP